MTEGLSTVYASAPWPALAELVVRATGTSPDHQTVFIDNFTFSGGAAASYPMPAFAGKDPTARLGQLLRELRALSFAREEDPRPSELAKHLAMQLLEMSSSIEMLPSRLRSSPDGGIILAFRNGEQYGKVEIYNDGEILAATSGYEATPFVWPVLGMSSAKATLERIQAHTS